MNDYTFEPVGDTTKPYTPLSADTVNELDQARRALDAVMGPVGMTAGEWLEAERARTQTVMSADPEPDEPQDPITGFVTVDADGMRVVDARGYADDLAYAHYGDGDPDPNAVVYVHLRGSYELKVPVIRTESDGTDDRDYIHMRTVVYVDGVEIQTIHWTIDGRA